MSNAHPLQIWPTSADFSPAKLDGRAEAWLAEVERQVEQPKPKYRFGGFAQSPEVPTRRLRERAEALFPRVWRGTGAGKQEVELSLLWLVAAAADPASVPFWKETVALSHVGDRIASKRREIAAAALAMTALQHPASGAFAALVALTEDEHLDARVGAVDILAFLAENEEWAGSLARMAVEILRRVAREAQAFAPRYLARRFLLIRGEPLPAYERGDAIAFEVRYGKCHRTIELLADQTLVDLHFAILDAFGWDTDHLYAFSLSGDLRDSRFTIPEDEAAYFEIFDDETEEPSEPPFPVGAMGLPVGHELVYLYDFGDRHVFRIKVTEVHPRAPRAKYPRVTEKVGKSPAQYPAW